MSRSMILLLLFVIGLALFVYYLSTIETGVETQSIEEPVSDEVLQS